MGTHHVERLADNVFAIVRHDPIAFVNNANSLVVIGDSGVLVVDAQFTRLATNETIAEIRKLTMKPVRYVVNTHWHDDHVAGNQAYRDSFPGVTFVSHPLTRADLITLGAPNRKASWEVGPQFVARFERLLGLGLGVDSTAVTPSERRAMESTIAIGRQYVAEKDAFREELATLTFSDRLTIHLGASRTVEIHYFGRANTRGDAVVWVPDARVVATGDLVVHPVPFGFNAFVRDWTAALDSVLLLKPVAFVPGHGPVMHDASYVETVRDMLAAVTEQTAQVAHSGWPLDSARKRVTLADYRRRVSGGDPWFDKLFGRFFLDPVVSRAFAETPQR